MNEIACYIAGDNSPEDPIMKFRLTYEGEVPSGQSKSGPAKRDLRAAFHEQLENLWKYHPFLRRAYTIEGGVHPESATNAAGFVNREDFNKFGSGGGKKIWLAEGIGDSHKENGYRFVPLVRDRSNLVCGLDILLLRNDDVFSPVSAGDLDNRVKTIIDGLKRPKNANELIGYEGVTREDGKDPLMFVLLEDDELISSLNVEADALLAPPPGKTKLSRWAKVVVTVNVRPTITSLDNLFYL